jgi:SnoaL-like domain
MGPWPTEKPYSHCCQPRLRSRSGSSPVGGKTAGPGLLKNGNQTDAWVRWTACFRKIDGEWLIVHDHISVPLEMKSGRAFLNLEP